MREGLEIGKAMKLWNKLRQGLAVFGIWWEAAVGVRVREKVISVTAFSVREQGEELGWFGWRRGCISVEALTGHSELEIQNWSVEGHWAEMGSAVICTEVVFAARAVRGHCKARSRPRTMLWASLTFEEHQDD